jgi:hypothetical protein
MTATRRWFRVWFRWSDALRSEDTLMMQATDEHSIYKLLAGEGKRVTACYADYTTHPTEGTTHD